MTKRFVLTATAPKPIGPYSQAVVAGDLVFCAGQIGLDPTSGTLVAGGLGAEASRAIDNLAAVLAAEGLGLGDVVKTTVYLLDLGEGPVLNEVYGRRFGAPHPARATVQVSALPAGARVEIDAVAVRSASLSRP
jgi:2-iminobutanoate/2-iminopropanoate deaminase